MNAIESLLDFAKQNVPFHKRRAPELFRDLSQWPFMSKHDLAEYPLGLSDELLAQSLEPGGHAVASGGTTTMPKYIYYSHTEAAAVTSNIAKHFMANGMELGDSVVNYLSSGDMWSSFLMVDKALSSLPVTIYPLGCTSRLDFAVEILQRFKPNAIIGIPSMLLDLARHCSVKAGNLYMKKVFYAGEPMSATSEALLTSIWKCQFVRSAGYAATDVGSIGWQCPHCETGEHYAFDDVVVEICDGEIVVTSLTRRAMPMIRYRTGDKGKWITPSCDCGHGAPTFKLLGRLDNVILLWGCRILYDEIAAAFEDMNFKITALQAQVQPRRGDYALVIKYESTEGYCEEQALRDRVWERCGDLKESVPRDVLNACLTFESSPLGSLERNQRTGKVIPIIDPR